MKMSISTSVLVRWEQTPLQTWILVRWEAHANRSKMFKITEAHAVHLQNHRGPRGAFVFSYPAVNLNLTLRVSSKFGRFQDKNDRRVIQNRRMRAQKSFERQVILVL